jgi:hypothetical protein
LQLGHIIARRSRLTCVGCWNLGCLFQGAGRGKRETGAYANDSPKWARMTARCHRPRSACDNSPPSPSPGSSSPRDNRPFLKEADEVSEALVIGEPEGNISQYKDLDEHFVTLCLSRNMDNPFPKDGLDNYSLSRWSFEGFLALLQSFLEVFFHRCSRSSLSLDLKMFQKGSTAFA